MTNPKTDSLGNCVECGRLIVPKESDILKALLVLHNAGYTSICLKGNGLVLLSPDAHADQYAEDNTCDRLRRALNHYDDVRCIGRGNDGCGYRGGASGQTCPECGGMLLSRAARDEAGHGGAINGKRIHLS